MILRCVAMLAALAAGLLASASPVLAQGETQIEMSFRTLGRKAESLAITGGRIVDVARRRQGVAQVGVDLGIIGFDLQDLPIASGCRRELTQGLERGSQVIFGDKKVGLPV